MIVSGSVGQGPVPRDYLEDRDGAGDDAVKVAPGVGLEPPAEDLHAEQGHDEDRQEEQDDEGRDARDRVDEGLHQVSHRSPVPWIGVGGVVGGYTNEQTYQN